MYQFTVDLLNSLAVNEERVMTATGEQFLTLAIRPTKEVSISHVVPHTFWSVPTKFAYFRFISDRRSLSVGVVPENEGPKKKRSENATFVDIGLPDETTLGSKLFMCKLQAT